jgi:hypothetical protein
MSPGSLGSRAGRRHPNLSPLTEQHNLPHCHHSVTNDILARGMPAADNTSTAAELTRLHLAGNLSRERVESEVAVSLLAGTNSTADSLQNILMLLAQHPEWQDRIVEELHAAGRGAVGGRWEGEEGTECRSWGGQRHLGDVQHGSWAAQ